MKKSYLFIILCIAVQSVSAQFTFQNVTLLSDFDDLAVTAEPSYGIRYQSCWGWADTLSGREYGIIGSTTGTYFIEVTDPTMPFQRDYVSSHHTNLIWHEYKMYGKYLYIISDGPSSNQLQICDLSYLPDSVHVVYDSNTLISRAHTISIDGNKLYLGSPTSGTTYSMRVYSLNNPELPVLLRTLNQDYPSISSVHDMFVVHDTVYASCGYDGLFIYKFDTITNHFSQIGSLTTYPDQGYNHSSVLSGDHSTLYMCDELPEGMGNKIVDVTTISNPTCDSVFYTNVGDTPHNPFVKGNFLYIAAYQDGVYIYDISHPRVPVLAGFFDTHPQNGTTYVSGQGDRGCWSVYTDLPSGTLLAADMQKGLFCLDVSQITSGIHQTHFSNEGVFVYPNPANDLLKIKLNLKNTADCNIRITDILGNERKHFNASNSVNGEFQMSLSDLQPGIYLVKVKTADKTFIQKVNVVK
jgi:choice-of-anchor B domain-containing protein